MVYNACTYLSWFLFWEHILGEEEKKEAKMMVNIVYPVFAFVAKHITGFPQLCICELRCGLLLRTVHYLGSLLFFDNLRYRK